MLTKNEQDMKLLIYTL